MAPLKEALDKSRVPHQLVCVNGPQAVPYVADGLTRNKMFEKRFGSQMYRWYEWVHEPEHKKTGGGSWPDVGDALKSAKALMTTGEPFHGVVGFSQGGGVAALIAALAQRGEICKQELLRFVVLMDAPQYFPLGSEPLQGLFPEGKLLTTPSLHTYGEKDGHLKFIKDFVPLFQGAKELVHKDGHQPFPGDEAEQQKFATDVAIFIKEHTQRK
jgi:pimeloyl-ACP methyl ester carboxylesterase